MKRNMLMILALLLCSAGFLQAQILNESFEGTTFPPEGWTAIPSTEVNATKHWERIYREKDNHMSGKAYVEVITDSSEPAKEEWLITPEVEIPSEGVYSFQFKWYGQKVGFEKYCDLQIKVQENGNADWVTIWDINNDEQVEASGVVCPWKQWTVYTSDIDLSTWKGKKVKFAFYYTSAPKPLYDGAMYASGLIDIDDVKIDKYIAPVPVVSGTTSYKFENVYIGVRKQGILTLKNSGKDVLRITGISGLEETDFSTNLAIDAVALKSGEEMSYYVFYNPTMGGLGSVTLNIQTNGGNLDVVLSGSKTIIPEGYTLESFESGIMPPLGWTNSGWKISKTVAISGLYSAVSGILEQCTLTSPRLDLSGGNHKVVFDFIESYIDETGEAVPVNDFTLELKQDDGNWEEIWFAKDLIFQEIIRVSVDLNSTSNNCYLRWRYTGDFSGGFDSVISDIYFDDIVLPPLYKEGALLPAQNPVPKNGMINCSYTDIELSWEGVLFAEGYKLYVGTDQNNPISLVDGATLTETSYKTGVLAPNTTYYWKVIPYNETGEVTDVTVWSFTTMADQTISTFPYNMDFEGDTFPPLGWTVYGDGKGWNQNSYYPFNGKNSCSVFLNASQNQEASLQTSLIQLPTEEIVAAFWWAKNMPVNLEKQSDDSKLTGTDNGNDALYFEIKSADGEWTELAKTFEEKYWSQMVVSLKNYMGKQVWMRWRYAAQNGYSANAGAALDDFYLGNKGMVGIQEAFTGNISVYPTVATEVIYLEGVSLEMTALIYDLTGNVVLEVENTTQINVSSIPQGIYILSICQNNQIYNTRIIKK